MAAASGTGATASSATSASSSTAPPTTTTTTPPPISTTTTPPPPPPTHVPATTPSTPKPAAKAAPVKPAPTGLVPGTPCAATDSACASLSTNQAWLIRDGVVVSGPVQIKPGGPGADRATPTGTFHVLSKQKDFWSTEFNAPMPNSVFFYPGDAFHTGSLERYSAGCVHLAAADSQRFYDFLKIGDVVQILP
ncbi:L,D-transpeptidase [Solihabitans fulvus]|uniref:L,D-transpeptidase n=1 Tax=Solihabitans fulvus TaxID=1892852 RepID=A0A5B2X4B3_9PSEU|nr:L,D-transpeptidase [Solihabitans fulvus]